MKNELLFKYLKKPFFGKYMVKWINPMTAVEKEKWTSIQIESKSGGKIATLYSATHLEAKATIILGHPMGKEAKGFFIKNGYVDLYKNNGFDVLLFDFNGFGESTFGNFSYFEDIIAVSHFAKKIIQIYLFYITACHLAGKCPQLHTQIKHTLSIMQ